MSKTRNGPIYPQQAARSTSRSGREFDHKARQKGELSGLPLQICNNGLERDVIFK